MLRRANFVLLEIVDIDAKERTVVQKAELLVRLLRIGSALIVEKRVVLLDISPDLLVQPDRNSVRLQPAVLRLPESSGRSSLENLEHFLIELVCFHLVTVKKIYTYLQLSNFLVQAADSGNNQFLVYGKLLADDFCHRVYLVHDFRVQRNHTVF